MIVPKSELYELNKNAQSLWCFIESESSSKFLPDKKKVELLRWIDQVNYKHHNDRDFFDNFKEIFKTNNVCQINFGQEDLGAVCLGNEVVVVSNADMGVCFKLAKQNSTLNPDSITEDQWNNYEKLLTALEVAFINVKEFHLLNFFDKLNNDIKVNDSCKQQKFKI